MQLTVEDNGLRRVWRRRPKPFGDLEEAMNDEVQDELDQLRERQGMSASINSIRRRKYILSSAFKERTSRKLMIDRPM